MKSSSVAAFTVGVGVPAGAIAADNSPSVVAPVAVVTPVHLSGNVGFDFDFPVMLFTAPLSARVNYRF